MKENFKELQGKEIRTFQLYQEYFFILFREVILIKDYVFNLHNDDDDDDDDDELFLWYG